MTMRWHAEAFRTPIRTIAYTTRSGTTGSNAPFAYKLLVVALGLAGLLVAAIGLVASLIVPAIWTNALVVAGFMAFVAASVLARFVHPKPKPGVGRAWKRC